MRPSRGGPLAYSLTGTDASDFTINSSTGAVSINAVPSYETQSSYAFNVVATETAPGALATAEAVALSINDLPPVFSSGSTANVNEGVAAGTTVYTAVAAEPGGGPLAYSLTGTDASDFTINSSTGAVSINAVPSYETQSSYAFNVVATETAPGALATAEAVALSINDLPPVFSSGSTANVNEGVAAGTTVYTAVAAEPGGGPLAYSLTGTDASDFTINSSTGAVSINAVPSYETQSSYAFNVVATETAPGALATAEAVALSINDLPPVFSSGSTANVNEGVAAGTTVYTAVAAEPGGGPLAYSLTGTDASDFTINSSTGAVSINAVPSYETQSSYAFNVVATETAPGALATAEAVALSINDLPPVFSSGSTANVNEGVAAGTTVYTAVAAEPGGGPLAYSLTGTDASDFTINSSTGAVSINAVPSYETQSSYAFNVVATETAPGALATAEAVALAVNPVAPTLTVANSTLSVDENNSVALGISETPAVSNDDVTITITGLPADAALSDANHDTLTINNGSIILTPSELSGLTFNAGDTSADLTVTATNTEGAGASSASQSIEITVVQGPSEPFTWATNSSGAWTDPTSWDDDGFYPGQAGNSDQVEISATAGIVVTYDFDGNDRQHHHQQQCDAQHYRRLADDHVQRGATPRPRRDRKRRNPSTHQRVSGPRYQFRRICCHRRQLGAADRRRR